MPLLSSAIKKISARQDLSAEESREVFDAIFSGTASRHDLTALLLGLREKGETSDEILGAAQSMRGNMLAIRAPKNAVDIVGTGGDNHGTLNVSTAAAFVVAGCGVPVAKHGNRAATSRSGSSDVLHRLGVNLEPEFGVLEKSLNEVGIAFLFAPRHHPAMRFVAEVRRELKVRTIFNLLGPLTNPANVKMHMIGAVAPQWLRPMAEVLNRLGSERAWLAHGRDGMDEISTTCPTDIVELRAGEFRQFALSPEEIALPRATLADIKGGDPGENAEAILRLLNGERGAYRDIVIINAAAALVVAGKADDMPKAAALAGEAIDSGAAMGKLEALRQIAAHKHV